MRPVTRGAAPATYSNYQDAIGDLEERLDQYCSYCERRLPISLAVEHVAPKSLNAGSELDWDNFLLSCVNCNSVKGKKQTNATDFLWPDRDNTLRSFDYKAGGWVEPKGTLMKPLRDKAQKLIDLVGLDRHPGQPTAKQPAKRDQRYMHREEVWQLAKLQREALARNDSQDLRAAIAELSRGYGFFSIWMATFHDDPDMRRRFVACLKGTALDCFDVNWDCVTRPGGHI